MGFGHEKPDVYRTRMCTGHRSRIWLGPIISVREVQPQYTVGIDPDPDSDPDTDGNQERMDRVGGTGNSLPVLRSNKRCLDIFTIQDKTRPDRGRDYNRGRGRYRNRNRRKKDGILARETGCVPYIDRVCRLGLSFLCVRSNHHTPSESIPIPIPTPTPMGIRSRWIAR
jgi:hypothetical protein